MIEPVAPPAAPAPVDQGAGRATSRGRGRRPDALPPDPGRATEQLYQLHGGTVLRYAWHLLGTREDAEDATQATFLAAHGALARGTAVLQPGAWVLSIARNECMSRLRSLANRPAIDLLDEESHAPAVGDVAQAAEAREAMRTAHLTLSVLPEAEREAFLLREWMGLELAEAAIALGRSTAEVEMLAVRARRSLMIAVGGLEPAVGCAGTRSALETGSLGRANKVHLLRCPVCRGVRRALRAPDAGRARLPTAGVAERLAALVPGFGIGGGGVFAALASKTAAAPLATKTAMVVAAAIAAGGVAASDTIRNALPLHHRGLHGQARAIDPHGLPDPARRGGRAAAVQGAPRPTGSLAALRADSTPPPTSGVAGTSRGGRGTASSATRGDDGGGARAQSPVDDRRARDGEHSGSDDGVSTRAAHAGDPGEKSGDARGSASADDHGSVAGKAPGEGAGDSSEADLADAEEGAQSEPQATVPTDGGGGGSDHSDGDAGETPSSRDGAEAAPETDTAPPA